MVEFAPAEISALELYESSLAKQSERKSVRQRQLEVERVEFKRKIRFVVDDASVDPWKEMKLFLLPLFLYLSVLLIFLNNDIKER